MLGYCHFAGIASVATYLNLHPSSSCVSDWRYCPHLHSRHGHAVPPVSCNKYEPNHHVEKDWKGKSFLNHLESTKNGRVQEQTLSLPKDIPHVTGFSTCPAQPGLRAWAQMHRAHQERIGALAVFGLPWHGPKRWRCRNARRIEENWRHSMSICWNDCT